MPRHKFYVLLRWVVGLITIAAIPFDWLELPLYRDDAVTVIKNYVQAMYARDFAEAYRLISAEDQRIRDQEDYVRAQGPYDGFTLRLAKSLAEKMDFAVLEDKRIGQRARITARFKLPSPEDLSPLVQNWDSEKLNLKTPLQQRQILDKVEQLTRDKKLLMVEAQETFEMVKEGGGGWRLFFDWAAGMNVTFSFSAPSDSGIDLQFEEKDLVMKPEEPFAVRFKIKNRGSHAVAATIVHRVEPSIVGDKLEMVQCGLLSPLTLAPGKEQEMVSVYIFSGDISQTKHIAIAYEFKVEPMVPSIVPKI
jgi:hypothetical protein